MDNVGFLSEGFFFLIVLAFGIHQLYDLKREKKKREQQKQKD